MKNSQKELKKSLAGECVIAAIALYQKVLSPDSGILRYALKSFFFLTPNPGCRFTPSCSDYARDQISQYGLSKGSMMFLRRIVSCSFFYNEASRMVATHVVIHPKKVEEDGKY